jgi:hypothetical protein
MIDIREQINVQVKENVKKTQETQVRRHKIKKMSQKMKKNEIHEGDRILVSFVQTLLGKDLF